MNKLNPATRRLALAALALTLLAGCRQDSNPLPSWNPTSSRQAVIDFVKKVTDHGSPHYVAPADRLAVFDNDGTLWPEQPLYVEVLFAADQMKAVASQHPEWKDTPAFQQVITGPPDAILGLEGKDQFAVAFAVHSGMTTEAYANAVDVWLATHKYPRFSKSYLDVAYQPMLEVIAYLRANEFQVYSVTGAEVGFARIANAKSFGIPSDHVIGTLLKTTFDPTVNPAQLVAQPDVVLVDDGPGKPASISNVLGRRPLAAFGNSDGDLPMLQWTASGTGLRFAALVHHDDADREFAYDRTSPVGHLDKALDAAKEKNWTVISMKGDWKQIFK